MPTTTSTKRPAPRVAANPPSHPSRTTRTTGVASAAAHTKRVACTVAASKMAAAAAKPASTSKSTTKSTTKSMSKTTSKPTSKSTLRTAHSTMTDPKPTHSSMKPDRHARGTSQTGGFLKFFGDRELTQQEKIIAYGNMNREFTTRGGTARYATDKQHMRSAVDSFTPDPSAWRK